MKLLGIVTLTIVVATAVAAARQAPATTSSSPSTLTIAGCLQQTSDSPDAFVFRPGTDATPAWNASMAPVYRVSGTNLKAHAGHKVELTGTVTKSKDEPGVDAAMAQIGPEKTIITTIDVKAAPMLSVTNVKMVAATCALAPWPGNTAAGGAAHVGALSGEPMTASVDDVSNSPDRFVGKTVRLTEDVARVLGPRVFTLDEETPLGLGKDVLVIAPAGVTVREDQDVEVIGVVRRFSWTELEKERFDIDFKREWQLEFNSRPVVLATSVRPR